MVAWCSTTLGQVSVRDKSFFIRMPAICATEHNDITQEIFHLKDTFVFLSEYARENESLSEGLPRPLLDQKARLAPAHLDLDVRVWLAGDIEDIEVSHYGYKLLRRPRRT
jgi:hypothetical protein